LGWRATYSLMGVLGIIFGVLSNIYIREPVNKEEDLQK
jgi:predicted MFS family arabinose efflux permease